MCSLEKEPLSLRDLGNNEINPEQYKSERKNMVIEKHGDTNETSYFWIREQSFPSKTGNITN